MYYVVGEIGDYVYVYDSDDGSCELIKSDILYGVDYEVKRDNSIYFHKLCIMCSIPKFKSFAYKSIVERMSFNIRVFVVKAEYVQDEIFYDVYKVWGCGTSYFVFVGISDIIPDSKVFRNVVVYRHEDYGGFMISNALLIPPIMLPYLLNLRERKDIELLRRALCNCVSRFDYLYDCVFCSDKWTVK